MYSLLKKLCVAACAALACGAVQAQPAYPSQPLHMVTAFAAGSASDIVARMIAERLQAALGQPVIVETTPGPSGQGASDYVARAEPDGVPIIVATRSAARRVGNEGVRTCRTRVAPY